MLKGLWKNKFLAIILVSPLIISTTVGYYAYSTASKFQVDQSKFQAELDNLSSQMAGLQAELNESQNNNNETKFDLNNLQSQFSELQSQFNSLQAEYNNLSSRYSTAESHYNSLQSQYSNLQTSFTKFVADYQTVRTIEPYNYLVFSDGVGNYYAENGATGSIDFVGTSGTQVGQSCINALSTAGGKIVFAGWISLNGTLIIQSG